MSFICIYLLFNLLLILLFTNPTNGNGGSSTRVQCPEGHFLSRFSSAFDGSERYYKFGCQAFNALWLPDGEEHCVNTEFASLEAGSDIYLSCGNNQYTAGIQIVESMQSTAGQNLIEHWQLLCCYSNSIRVRTADCVETKFVNDYRRSSTFSSSAQIIRRWQAMSENSDRRWWLQICPVDVQSTKSRKNIGDVEVRARRHVPVEWSNSRFSYTPEQPSKLKPFYRRGSQIVNPNKWPRDPQLTNTLNSYSFGNGDIRFGEIPSTITTTLSTSIATSKRSEISVAEKEEEEETTTNEPKNATENNNPKSITAKRRIIPLRHSRLLQYNEKAKTKQNPQQDETTPENILKMKSSNEPQKSTGHSTDVLDYYDMYDDNFDKSKHQGSGSLLDGVTDFIQSLQDGLTLAQAAFPAKINMERSDGPGRKGFQLRIAVTHPPNTVDLRNRKSEFAFSKDEASSNEKDDRRWDDRHTGSFVQQNDSPVTVIPRRSEYIKRESNTIESMLQMIGLCQGHPEL